MNVRSPDYVTVTGRTRDYATVTGRTRDYAIVTGRTRDNVTVTGCTRDNVTVNECSFSSGINARHLLCRSVATDYDVTTLDSDFTTKYTFGHDARH